MLSVRLDADYIYLADVSDIHIGNIYHNKEAFDKFIKGVMDIPNMYVIIGGDSTDGSSTTTASSLFEESIHGSEQVLTAVQLLKPIQDRILFVRSGNNGYERALKHGKMIPEQMLAYMCIYQRT